MRTERAGCNDLQRILQRQVRVDAEPFTRVPVPGYVKLPRLHEFQAHERRIELFVPIVSKPGTIACDEASSLN